MNYKLIHLFGIMVKVEVSVARLNINIAWIKGERCPRLSCRGCRFIHVTETFFPRPRLVRGSEEEDPSHNCEDLAALFIRSLPHYLLRFCTFHQEILFSKRKTDERKEHKWVSVQKVLFMAMLRNVEVGCVFLNVCLSLRK